ncbi:putative alanine aminotransferase [Gregarina niphandrodes]|uniref:Alanine aminotransferase n=1 Tax=Gregarina niphandrodes TaxID=110365 RepID=A0A023B2Y4_GRENI|nr:putative alanine aminotransferase [Gregarina niphandrodes]EZG53504.1 putative alanine aminotransferase [Gregarina niphandrodes]|eukprot:XP_011131871.1 putative alanine aminotransferase [Gregarina niphandrodes]
MHSCSKGFYGECGFRGGLMQLENFDKDSLALIYKVRSVELCANTTGQICMALVACPPKPGTPSFNQYLEERNEALQALAYKAQLMSTFFNSLTGVTCQPIYGALYAFPRLTLPPRFVQEAAALGRLADLHYCLMLLNATGIVCSPGNAFGPNVPAANLATATECTPGPLENAPPAITPAPITPAPVSAAPVSATSVESVSAFPTVPTVRGATLTAPIKPVPTNLPVSPVVVTEDARYIPAAAAKNPGLLSSATGLEHTTIPSKASQDENSRLTVPSVAEPPKSEAHEVYHMRITILPTVPELSKALDSYRAFHEQLMADYSTTVLENPSDVDTNVVA